MTQEVWVHSFALTFGRIFSRQAEIGESGQAITALWTYWPGEWSNSKEEAVAHANQLKESEITRLQGQVKRLESLQFWFEAPPGH